MINIEFIREVGVLKWFFRTSWRQFTKRLLKTGLTLRLPTGTYMKIPRNSQHGSEAFVTNADIDWGAEKLFSLAADPKRDLLDIGAHIGYYSLYISPLVRNVYAFEPDPRNFSQLAINIGQIENAVHVPKAVADTSGSVRMDISKDSSVSSIVDDLAGAFSVECVTIDHFCETNPDVSVGLIKIDIEGHDLAAVTGGLNCIIRDQPLVLIEFGPGSTNPTAINNPDKLIDTCSKINYSLFALTLTKGLLRKRYLVEVKREHFGTIPLKMIFLVPSRLHSKFLSQAKRQPMKGSEEVTVAIN